MRHVNWSDWMTRAGLILTQKIMRVNIPNNQFSRDILTKSIVKLHFTVRFFAL